MPNLSEHKIRPTVKPIKRGQEEKPAAPVVQPAPNTMPQDKVPSGIPGLDELIGGGFERGSTTLVMGGAGSGKTTLLAQYLFAGASQYGEPGVFLTFEESAESIFKHMLNFGFDFKALEEQNLFATINYRPHEVKKLVEEGGGLIMDTITSIGAKRLCIDSLTSYMALFESAYQARESEIALFDLLRKWGCTSLLSVEGRLSDKERRTVGLEYLSDGVIVMHHPRNQSVRYRAIEVLKMRGSRPSERVCPFEFVDNLGIRVYPNEIVFYDIDDD
ncbi:MAG: ATPase domain-containing protein [Candidatus Anstonellaceae archaeon]